MKNFLLTITLAMAVVASAWAGPRSLQQAKAIARQQASTLGIALTESNITNARVKGQAASANASYYVFTNNDNNGFVIISGDDLMPDLVGYSTDGTFDGDEIPANMQDYLNAYDATVKAVQRGDKAALSIVAEAKALRDSKNTNVVAPLLEKEGINFDQTEPYNLLCPTYKDKAGNEYYCATGCAATAMAQILKYYKYPSATMADIPTYTSSTLGITMPAIPKGTAIDWDNILNTYRHVDYTDDQALAIASLMIYCGYSMKMDYYNESSANPSVDNFIDFGYDPDLIQMVSRYAFTLKQWTSLIDAELAAGRPVYYIGFSQTSGHAFLCDGSDANGLYHINWGWNGRKNSYFDISILNPDKGGTGSGDDTEGYSRDCSMIIGIAPDNGVEDQPLATYPKVTFSYYRPDEGKDDVPTNNWSIWRDSASDTFEGQISGSILYNGNDCFTGKFGFGIKKSDGTYDILDQEKIPEPGLPAGFTFNYQTSKIKRAFPVGKTEILPLYSLDGGNNWNVCSMNGVAPIVLNATETDLSFGNAMDVTMEFADKDIYVNTPNNATIKIKSNMSQEYNGTLYLYMQDMQSDSAKIIGNIYVSLLPGEEVTQTLPVTPKFLGSGDDHEVQIAIMDLGLTKYFVDFYPIHETATPVIKLVGVETNADPEDTTSQAEYVDQKDNNKKYNFLVPEVKHDKFNVTFTLQNSAEKTSALKYVIYAFNPVAKNDRQQVAGVARIDGNGATTEVSATIDPFETGNNIVAVLYIYSEKDGQYMPTVDTDLPSTTYYATDATQKTLPANYVWVYVTGEADGIEAVTTNEGDFVGGGNGMIVIKSSEAKHVNIFNLSGQKVAEASLSAGEQQTITVRPGIYIVGGKKVAVN